MRMAMLVCFAFAVMMMLAACAQTDRPICAEGTEQFVKYELFMGRNSQSGEVVDDAAWTTFLEDSVTPRFPDGLTVLDAEGQWRDSEGLVQKERSKLLLVLVPPGDDGKRWSEKFQTNTSVDSARNPCCGSGPMRASRSPDTYDT